MAEGIEPLREKHIDECAKTVRFDFQRGAVEPKLDARNRPEEAGLDPGGARVLGVGVARR